MRSLYHPTERWRLRAVLELNGVTSASRRYSASITLRNRFAMLAAAKELEAVTKEAETWLSAHPCSDEKLGARHRGDAEHKRRGGDDCTAGSG